MQNPTPEELPQLVSLRTHSTRGGEVFEVHSHTFLEFSLVTDDDCTVDLPPEERKTSANTLLHYHPGERHGAHCSSSQKPRFWVVHFKAGDGMFHTLEGLSAKLRDERIWKLQPEQAETFQWIFMQMLNERSAKRPYRDLATSGWLQLLLINIQRWAERSTDLGINVPARANPEVIELWHKVNESVGKSNDQLGDLYSAPNYDSVRHAFRKSFGCSPREMLQRLRMEHAKNLLLESSLSIKEIAGRVGYYQQHDFNRMFHRFAGMAPSHWRSDPSARSIDE